MSMASSSFIAAARPFGSPRISGAAKLSNQILPLGAKKNAAFRLNVVAKKWEPTKVKPQADRVLIRLEALPEKSAGGVLLPKSAVKFERYLMGEVLAAGDDVGEVEVGKKVLLSDINAYEIDLGTDDDTRHVFCKESDLLAMIE